MFVNFELSRQNIEIVDEAWAMITLQFEKLSKHENRLRMDRKEISFHSQVKLLGHLLLQTESIKGDVLEIGIWKGKSLSLLSYFTKAGKVIGIDPFEFRNQKAEVEYFSKAMFKDAILIPDFSEHAIKKVLEYSHGFKLIHIDGGHEMKNVLLDFLIYSPFIVEGGYIVFDDYGHRYNEFATDMTQWLSEGKVKYREQLIDGLESAPQAFIGLLEGKNFGKLVIQINQPL
jgi:cephalosporin hydroxylase